MDEIQQLVKKARHGNVDAYGKLIGHYKEYLYRTAFLHTKNEQDALDCVSECVLRGFKNIRRLKKDDYFKTWITRILLNTVFDTYRKKESTTNIEDIAIANPENGISKEECLDLYQAIDALSDPYKTVIILKYFSEFKLSEISAIMNIPQGSVSAYLSRAKNELRNYLKEDYYA